jgi:predicted nucleotidyltransferase
MAYTEIKERNENRYYYRALSVREGVKVRKKRIYLGLNLNKKDLKEAELRADYNIIKGNIEKNISAIKPTIIKTLKKYNVTKASIFGSYAKGKETKKSDIDIIIEYPKGMGFKFAGINLELEKKLGRKVDIITYGSINPHLKKEILSHEVRII